MMLKEDAPFNSVGNVAGLDRNPPGPSSILARLKRRSPLEEEPVKIPVYVRRDLVNSDEFMDWAKGTKMFKQILGKSEYHVTIVYSKNPADYNSIIPMMDTLIVHGGERSIHAFNNHKNPGKRDVVLTFESELLQARHLDLKKYGAISDHSIYRPHVTITYGVGAEVEVSRIVPYSGPLEFGPEIKQKLTKLFDPATIEQVKA